MPTPEELVAAAAANKPGDVVVPDKPEPDKVADAPDPVETSARAKGWKPQEEYKGDRPWVDAKTFLDREPLIERISGQSKTIARLERTVEAMARNYNKNLEHAINAKIAELEYQKEEAVKSGNVAEVKAIDKAIDHQRAAKADAATPAAKAEVAPEVAEWIEANPWYVNDREMHNFAYAYNEAYLKSHPGDLAGCLRETAKATRRAFPDKFSKSGGNGGERPPAPPSPDGGSPPAVPGKKYTVSRLTADQKLAHDQYIKAGTFDKAAAAAKMTPTEYYVKSLEEIGELTR